MKVAFLKKSFTLKSLFVAMTVVGIFMFLVHSMNEPLTKTELLAELVVSNLIDVVTRDRLQLTNDNLHLPIFLFQIEPNTYVSVWRDSVVSRPGVVKKTVVLSTRSKILDWVAIDDESWINDSQLVPYVSGDRLLVLSGTSRFGAKICNQVVIINNSRLRKLESEEGATENDRSNISNYDSRDRLE